MKVAHAHTTPWTPVRAVRGGTIEFKHLLQGEEKTPANYHLLLAETDISFKSPRHRHNFDQIRISLRGPTNIGPKHNIEPGDVVYFPEGTYYGPQDQQSTGQSCLAMVIQFGGASGNGFMSQRQLHEGFDKLQALGRFEGGVFRRNEPAADGRINQDAYEAVWEFQNGRPVTYPRSRLREPVHFHASHADWQPVGGQPGASVKALGSFGERGIAVGAIGLAPDARYTLPADAHERLVFVTEGEGRLDGGDSWHPHTALHLRVGESVQMNATTRTEALVLTLPLFDKEPS